MYPAGEVSTYRFDRKRVTDRQWQHSVIKFIKKAEVPIIPVYFHGQNSRKFHALGMLHPLLRTVRLPAELINKQGLEVKIRVGNPIPVKDQESFSDIVEYSNFLRTKTYAFSIPIKSEEKNKEKKEIANIQMEDIIAAVPQKRIEEEIERIKNEYLLFRLQNNMVFCVPSPSIPNTMKEIGRLRELTYRDVGEGTNNSIDIDEFDEYYEQLFIWDDEAKKIVGGYRVGKGKDVLALYGIKGFYVDSLFKMKSGFLPVLRETIELGRSFIVKEYQRKTYSLFLLWKGILYFLLKNPEYRYLMGPVSISNAFSDFAKSLLVTFVRANYYNYEYAEMVRPRKAFKVHIDRAIDMNTFIKHTSNDIGKFDRFVQDIEPGFRTPVLLKKYLNLNAELIGFNVDPKFSNCLDGLMILDLFDVPMNTIESLSKELDDNSILERFKK
ncbi:MAG: lysophospholipid acyltransferase family protein [Bacteroidota bacterium]|nr:lysophospholipid acyltransferase family protein [Bacteroidota bacterium]